MPPNDGVRLDEHQGGTLWCPDRRRSDSRVAGLYGETRSFDRAFQRLALLPKREILENQLVVSIARYSQRAAEQRNSGPARSDSVAPRQVESIVARHAAIMAKERRPDLADDVPMRSRLIQVAAVLTPGER
jgi:hypothetical protein